MRVNNSSQKKFSFSTAAPISMFQPQKLANQFRIYYGKWLSLLSPIKLARSVRERPTTTTEQKNSPRHLQSHFVFNFFAGWNPITIQNHYYYLDWCNRKTWITFTFFLICYVCERVNSNYTGIELFISIHLHDECWLNSRNIDFNLGLNLYD